MFNPHRATFSFMATCFAFADAKILIFFQSKEINNEFVIMEREIYAFCSAA